MATEAAVLAVIRAARPQCRSRVPADALGFAVHAAALAEGYELVATGARADTEVGGAGACPMGEEMTDPMDGWNAWDDAYAFGYVREGWTRSRMLLKALVAGDTMVVSAVVLPLVVGEAETMSTRPMSESKLGTTELRISAHVVPGDDATGTMMLSASRLTMLGEALERLRRDVFAPLTGEALRHDVATTAEDESTAMGSSGCGGKGTGVGTGAGAGKRRDNSNTGVGHHGDPLLRIGEPQRPGLGPEGFFDPHHMNRPSHNPSRPGGIGGGVLPAMPPLGARFDPYGPPDIPEFGPGRFGVDPSQGGGGGGDGSFGTPGPGYPDNPDHDFGGVPNGTADHGGRWGGGRRGSRGPLGWPQGRGGRGHGFNPDLGPPPEGTGDDMFG